MARSRRPHPAAPAAVIQEDPSPAGVGRGAAAPAEGEEDLVMLCVRVKPSLRRRLKLVAASSGRSVQAIAADALEAACKQYDM